MPEGLPVLLELELHVILCHGYRKLNSGPLEELSVTSPALSHHFKINLKVVKKGHTPKGCPTSAPTPSLQPLLGVSSHRRPSRSPSAEYHLCSCSLCGPGDICSSLSHQLTALNTPGALFQAQAGKYQEVTNPQLGREDSTWGPRKWAPVSLLPLWSPEAC